MAMKLKKGVTLNNGVVSIDQNVYKGTVPTTPTTGAGSQFTFDVKPPTQPIQTQPTQTTQTAQPTQTFQPSTSPVNYGTKMDTRTGLPEVMPTSPLVSKPTWETIGKQSDPNKVAQYLNTQPGFKTSVSGSTVTGTKNGVQTSWVFDGTNWVVKPSIATSENPVLSVSDATKEQPTPIDTTIQTPEGLKARYLEIASKLPSEITDEDRRFVNTIKARMSLGETSDQIFGTNASKSSGTTTYSQELIQPGENIASSTKNPDGTYTVTYKDGTTQQTSSKPSETVFPEGTPEYYAQKTAEANQARIDQMTAGYEAEKKKREESTAELVRKYGEDIASQYASQKAEIEDAGNKRMEALNSGLSFSGFGRSTMAVEKRDEIAKNIQDTINQAKSQADLKLAMYKAQQEGADSEALASMQEGITRLQNGIDDANYKNQLAIIEMNQQNAQTGDAAMMALLGVLSNGPEIQADADVDQSRELGYFVDKQGRVMIDSQGRPIQFQATTSGLDPNQIQAYADAISKGIIKADDLDKTLTPAQKADIMKRVQVENGTYQGFGQIDVPRNVNGKTNNVGQDTNNPGNIMAESERGKEYAKGLGAIGFYTSPNGRTYAVFPDMNTGYNAMLKDVQGKISGGSSWATGDTTLGKLASGWVSGPNAPLNSAAVAAYVKSTGYPANTKIKDIPLEVLAKAIYSHEGVDITRNANIPSTGTGGGQGSNVIGKSGAPLDYERRIVSMIPTQLMNSEVELEMLMNNISKLHKSGATPEEATLTYLGFSVNDPKKKEEALKFVRQARGLGGEDLPETFMSVLSDYVNRGDMAGAKRYTERTTDDILRKRVPADQYVSTPSLNFNKNILDRLNGFITKVETQVGPVKGRFSDLKKKFGNDKDYQALATLLSGSNAEIRRAFAGTAVTDSEMSALRDFIGSDTKMPVENLRTVLQTNYDRIKSQYDSLRDFYVDDYQTGSTAPEQNMSMMPGAKQTGGTTSTSDWDF